MSASSSSSDPSVTPPDPPTPPDRAVSDDTATSGNQLAVLSTALERMASWLRRTAPRSEHGLVAMSTLDMLVTDGPARISDLAARQSISQPGMTKLIARLADAGLVTRRADPADGRATLVAATEAGRAELDARHAVRVAVLAERIRGLPEAQQRALLAAADALTALSAPSPKPRAAAPTDDPPRPSSGRPGPDRAPRDADRHPHQ